MNTYKSELEFLLEREKIAKEICAELNNFTDLKSTLKSVMNHIKKITGCEVIGIRLNKDGDFPYYVYDGFSEDFILRENSLCRKDSNGNRMYCISKKGYLLECICGNVLQKRVKPQYDFFTEKGSFWTNNSTELFAEKDKIKVLMYARKTCNRCGYESVAHVPIKARGEVVGLIHLNDKKKDMFSKDLIEYLEMIGEHIGLAVHNCMIFEKLQEKLEQEERIIKEKEKLDTAKIEFFANVSHELKTPINVILGAIQVLDLNLNQAHTENFDEKLKKYLKMMKQNSYRLLRLVDNIVDQSKIDTGYLKLNLKNYNIVEVIENITLSIADYAGNKGIELIFDTDIEEKMMAIDDYKIERIMLNLLSNAIKFTSKGGKILVSIIDKDDKVLISVKDTGLGIPEDKLKVIFDRFEQVDKTLVRNKEGSGIGLSLVNALVGMHNGTISVSSIYGQGSEFIIELPVETIKQGEAEMESIIYESNVEKINIEFSDIYN